MDSHDFYGGLLHFRDDYDSDEHRVHGILGYRGHVDVGFWTTVIVLITVCRQHCNIVAKHIRGSSASGLPFPLG